MHETRLRPLERTILRLLGEGMSASEIGRRIGKRPGTVRRIIVMIGYKKDLENAPEPTRSTLTPLERVILRLKASGENYGEIGVRLGRSGAHIRRVESYAMLKSS